MTDFDKFFEAFSKLDENVFVESGRGKKTCGCGQVIAARCSKCEHCGHQFYETKQETEAKQATYSEAGRGRKQCPGCSQYVGARVLKCGNCQYDFQNSPKTKRQKLENFGEITTEMRKYADVLGAYNCRYVYTPSGHIPIRPYEFTEKAVFAFCDAIVELGLKDNCLYLPQAIKYMIAQRHGLSSQEYKDFCEHFQKWYDTVMSSESKEEVYG